MINDVERWLTATFRRQSNQSVQILDINQRLVAEKENQMRKLLIPVIGAAAALGVAAPACAQAWAPPSGNYQPYNPRDHELNFPRAMQARLERIRREIRTMQEQRVLSWREARSLNDRAARIEESIWRASRNGMQPGEARRIEDQIGRLQYRVSREAGDWNNRPGYRRY